LVSKSSSRKSSANSNAKKLTSKRKKK
jgi:hypothetical protein